MSHLTDDDNDWRPIAVLVDNTFCATGKGGGVDPTCSLGGSSAGASIADLKVRREALTQEILKSRSKAKTIALGKEAKELDAQIDAAKGPPSLDTLRKEKDTAVQGLVKARANLRDALVEKKKGEKGESDTAKRGKAVSISDRQLRAMAPDYSKAESPEEARRLEEAVFGYYGAHFQEMNGALREGRVSSSNVRDKIEAMQRAFDVVGHSLQEDTMVYRTVKKMPFDVTTVGAVFQDKGFGSTTVDKEIVRGIGIGGDTSERKLFNIRLPKGLKVIVGLGGRDDSVKEATLPAGLKFKVVKVGPKKLLGQVIDLEVVQ